MAEKERASGILMLSEHLLLVTGSGQTKFCTREVPLTCAYLRCRDTFRKGRNTLPLVGVWQDVLWLAEKAQSHRVSGAD